jgi:hypothetical protein
MKLKVIACRVFEPELDIILKCVGSSDSVTIDWLPLRAHDRPDDLRTDIQTLVSSAVDVDAVILAYGLCGNATAGIRAGSVPLFIPKAHDCSQILLGSRAAHARFFSDNPSRGWTSKGYMESEDQAFRDGEAIMDWDLKSLIEQYGEENAKFVWESLHASDSIDDAILYFLDVPETSDPQVLSRAREKAVERGKKLETVPATLELLSRLLGGRGGDEILQVAPGTLIRPSWDENVMTSGAE